MPVAPITPAEFAALMAPFGADRAVVVGVSGGADSMALAWLLRQWGAPLAVVVDHGLRPGSGLEAAVTMQRLAAMGVPARLIRLALAPGSGLGERARTARYGALLNVCREVGRPDLLVGHHARDQTETVVLRARAGSGPAGLAGMAAVSWRGAAQVLRPLLTVAPERLRGTLAAAGIEWSEDPTNLDPKTARGALRLGGTPACDPDPGRAAADQAVATELGSRVALFPTGHATVQAPLSERAWSALLWTISGRAHPPPVAGVRRLMARGHGTLHGVVVRNGLVAREPAAVAGPVAATPGAMWDGRFVLHAAVPGAVLRAVAADASRVARRVRWPSVVVQTLPAVDLGGNLFMVPHLDYPDVETCRSVRLGFRPMRPLAGGPFVPA